MLKSAMALMTGVSNYLIARQVSINELKCNFILAHIYLFS